MSPRDTSLLRVAVAAAGRRTAELRTQLSLALTHGVTAVELAYVLEEAARRGGLDTADSIDLLGEILRSADGSSR